MADNTTINTGSGGDVVRDIDRAGVKTQVMALDAGGATAESLVSTANPLPVKLVADATDTADNPTGVFLTGNPNGDFAGVNILEEIVNDQGDLRVNVKVADLGVLLDANKAIRLSDGIEYRFATSSAGASLLIFDCTGYQSFSFTLTTGTVQPGFSNDGVTYTNCLPIGISTGIPTNSPNNGTYAGPVQGKYLRLFPAGAVSGVLILKSGSFATIQPSVNISLVNGTAPVTAGVAGMLAVGGNIAAGVAPTANPVLTSGIDTAGLTRRFLTDASGRMLMAGQAVTGPTTAQASAAVGAIATSYQNGGALNIQEISRSQEDGATVVELLTQLLLEARITNQQNDAMQKSMFAICQLLTSNGVIPTANPELANEPAEYRNDPSFLQ